MKILCPRCSAENDTDQASAGMIQCVCGEWFKEPRDQSLKFTVDANAPLPTSDNGDATVREFYLNKRIEKIRRNACLLSNIGGIFAVIGFFAGIIGIIQIKSSESATGVFVFCLSAIGAGLWFYLIGQIVHIRANTEK